MRSVVRSALFTAVGVLFASSVLLAQTPQALDRWAGTWVLNTQTSKFSPGPAPLRNTLRLVVQEGGLKIVSDSVTQEGNPGFFEVLAKFDGTDREVTNAATPTARVYKWVSDTTHEYVTKVQGKNTTTTRAVMSADGKTITLTTSGTSAAGRPINNVQVFEKQQ